MITKGVHRYFWYAIGEVLLIFIGITLALAFDDYSERRRLHRQEIASLEDIASNLRTNIELFGDTIEADSAYLAGCRDAIRVVLARSPWEQDFGEFFAGCRYWTSPYLVTAAFDSLTARGTDLISNGEVRSSIVNLFDGQYAYLIGDMDRQQWDFQSAVVLSVWNRFFRTIAANTVVPSNYEALLDSEDLLNTLYNRVDLLVDSISVQESSLEYTQSVLESIEQELERLRTD